MGIGEDLPGKPFRRSEVIPVQALGHEPAEGNNADVSAGAQAFQGGSRRRSGRRIGGLQMQDRKVQLVQLVGRFEAAGLLELGDGFVRFLEAERKLGCDSVITGNVCGGVFEFVKGLRGQGVWRGLHMQGAEGEQEFVLDGWMHLDDPAAPVQNVWGARLFGQVGHELAGFQVEGIHLQSLAGTQRSIAIITFGQRLPGLFNPPLFLVMPIGSAPEKPEAKASDSDDQRRKDGFLHKYTGPGLDSLPALFVNENPSLRGNAGAFGHCPHQRSPRTGAWTYCRLWASNVHKWTSVVDRHSKPTRCPRSEGSVRIRHGNVPVRWRSRFEDGAWGAALLPGGSSHELEGGVTARKNLLGKVGVLELVYQNWPPTREFVLSETQLERLVAPQMEKP